MTNLKPIPLFISIIASLMLPITPWSIALADDTEIYASQFSNNNDNVRPQVLIIFDNSGSMSANTVPDTGGKTRLEVAKDAVNNIIGNNQNVDIGLMIYNVNNNTPHGGRLVHKISTAGGTIQNTITNLNGDTNTPLCETLSEAYRYFSGNSVFYGDDSNATPSADTTAEVDHDNDSDTPNKYISPMLDCQNASIIYMTDGLPFKDIDANDYIENLTGKTCASYLADGTEGNTKNCMPELSDYMANNDMDGDSTNGTQKVFTYTIGFAIDLPLLQHAAEGRTGDNALTGGGGEYHTAQNEDQLTAAFQASINSFLTDTTTFTSPAIAASTFDQTQHLDDIYLPMFKPFEKPRWKGNIKKLTISNGVLKDANNDDAILQDENSPKDGLIKDAAVTIWNASTGNDNSDVDKGGAGALLAANTSRTIKTNTGTSNALQDFNETNVIASAFGLTDPDAAVNNAALFALFGVTDQADLTATLNWAKGQDVDDEDEDSSTNDRREWVLADSLHFKPLAINYGCNRESDSTCTPDVRVVIGTNGGFLHMFNNSTGQEDWAFFPKELAPLLKILRTNNASATHPYGIDGNASVYVKDDNGDGYISGDDKVYLYFGLRRGGQAYSSDPSGIRAYYALDITNPGSPPSLLWKLDNISTGLSEFGQSWSKPVVGKIPGYFDTDGDGVKTYKPVLIFSAGYDTNKDVDEVGDADTMGRGIFIVDAATGALVWSITPAADSATNKQLSGITDSVAADVSVLDSNGDNLIDRMYFADTGANIWRVDLPGNSLPDADQDTWSVFKLASMGGTTAATDRRFFNKIDVVRTRDGTLSFDALLVGSGNRAHPNDRSTVVDDVTIPVTSDQLFMIRDLDLSPAFYKSSPTAAELLAGIRAIPSALVIGNLYNATANIIQEGTADTTDGGGNTVKGTSTLAKEALAAAKGWRVSLADNGEKSLSRAITLSGTVFFTSFVPADPTQNENICTPKIGTGFLYALSLQNATAVYNLGSVDGSALTAADRRLEIGDQILDTPAIHVDGDGNIDLLPPAGAGGEKFKEKLSREKLGLKLRPAGGTYWYKESK